MLLEDDDSFLGLEGNLDFDRTKGGFYEPKYGSRPEIYDIASKFGTNIQQSVFSPLARNYNNINISNYISSLDSPDYIVFVPVLIFLWFLFKWWLEWSRQIRSRKFLNNNLTPNLFLKEEMNEYCSYLNMESKQKTYNSGEMMTYEKEGHRISLSIPTFNLYVEFMFWKVLNRVSNSVDHFYDIIFEEKKMEEIYDEELTEGLTYTYHMETIREFYQQFCYWSLFEEEDLYSKRNIEKLILRGYRVVDREEEVSCLKKLLLKKNLPIQLISGMNVNDYKSSLHAFIELVCIQTNYDSDEVSLDLFTDNYVLFCNLFQLEQVSVDPNLLKREFNIDNLQKKVRLIERIDRLGESASKANSKNNKFYKLNLVKISEYLNLLKGSPFTERLPEADQRALIKKLVFPKSWLILDITVCVSIYLVMYIFLFFFLEHNESLTIMLSNFKRIPENQRIRDFSSFTVEGNMGSESVFTEPMSFALNIKYILQYCFLAFSSLAMLFGKDMFNYYNAGRSAALDLANDVIALFQWLLLFLSVGVFLWSIIQYLIATGIYSLMKIYALLPYVFSSMCFVFFIWYFIYYSRKKSISLEANIKADLKQILINRYVERLRHAANYNNERQKIEQLNDGNSFSSIQGSNQPLSDEVIKFAVGQVMNEVKEVCMLPENWKQFIESVLLGDKQKVQAVLAEIVEMAPLNLPQGTFELIAQILNIDENMDSPESFIQVISSILLKIILGIEKVFIKDLKLKDLDMLKTCKCEEEVMVDKNFVCKSCKNEELLAKNEDLYLKNKSEVFKLTLEKNTYIFQLLITLMDSIRRKTTGQILSILIDKIIPEGTPAGEKETTSCLMRLTYQAFFDIEQNFNRTDWAKCINDLMMNFFKSEQNTIQLINLLEEGRMDNSFDLSMKTIEPTETINSVKRCITSEVDHTIFKQTTCISNFLSLVIIFLGREPAIPEKLLKDILQVANKNSALPISPDTIKIIFKFILFSRETPKSILSKISLNAAKYFLDKEISDSISSIKSIASGISRDIKTKDYHTLESSEIFKQIRKVMNLQPYEMLGFVYLINDKVDDDDVSKFFHHIFTVNNFLKYERTLFDLIAIAVSQDYIKLGRAMENLKLKYHRMFAYMRGIIPLADLDGKYIVDIVQELPIEPAQAEETKALLSRCMDRRDLGPFISALIPKQDATYELNLDNPRMRNLRQLELIWMLNSDEKLSDVLIRFKSFFRELDDPLFLAFTLKLYTVLEYILKRKKILLESTISKRRAIKVMADLILTKADNIKNFLELFVADRTEDFIKAFGYFNEECQEIHDTNGMSLKNHIQYIDKSIKFLQAQIEFYSSNPIDYGEKGKDGKEFGSSEDDLGVIIIKKIMMPEVKLKNSQIKLLLDNIIAKIFNDEQISNRRVRIMKFFSALFVYVLGDMNSDLGDYFDKEHGEPFLKTLINCRGAKSSAQRINTFFEDSRINTKKITPIPLFVYLTLFLRGTLSRDEFNQKDEFEGKLCSALGVNKELFDYLDVCVHKNKLKFKSMLMSVHWKILKQLSGQNSFKREDVDWDQLYENILSVISDKQPNLTFFSDLLKVPLSQLNFVYILNNLKNAAKVDKVLQEANSNSSFKEIIEQMNVDHSEFIQIVRLCLNRAGFESLDILLKKMNRSEQDQIDISMIVSLVTMDAPLHIDADETRELIKRSKLYSKVFKKMKIDKDLAWAFIRILKGDMISFKKSLSSADSDIPANHKKFLNVVVALCGSKNSPLHYFTKENQMPLPEAVKKYSEISFDSKKKRENTREAAQILLSEQLDVHPIWGLLEHQVSRKVNASSSHVQKILDFRDNRIPIKVFHFIIMFSIIRSNHLGIEIFCNLSFLHNIVTALENMSIEGNQEAQKTFEELKQFYTQKFQEVKLTFRRRVLKSFNEREKGKLLNLSYNKVLTEYWMFDELTSAIKTKGDPKDSVSLFYSGLNSMLIENWKNKLTREGLFEQVEEVFPKLVEDFQGCSIYEAFNTGIKQNDQSGLESKSLFGPEMYDHFLDSVVELMLTKMKELNEMLYQVKRDASEQTTRMRPQGDFEDEDDEDDDELKDELEYIRGQDDDMNDAMSVDQNDDYEDDFGFKDPMNKGASTTNEQPIEAPKSLKRKFVSDGIIDFCLYASLMRLRRNTYKKFEEKVQEAENDFVKIDSLFSIVEKLSFFTKNFSGFRKKKYMTLFSFSQGMILTNGKASKPKYSLYSPELALLSSLKADHHYSQATVSLDLDFEFDPKEFLGKLHMVKDLLDYDLLHLSSFSPFSYLSFDIEEHHHRRNQELNLESNPDEVYFSQFLLKRPLSSRADLTRMAQDSKWVPLFNMITSNLSTDPTHISFFMLKENMYSLPGSPETVIKKIEETKKLYYSKYSVPVEDPDMKEIPKSDFEKNLDKMVIWCFLLNDIAQGEFKVLSETKNIFSNYVQYSKYQKVYEAILRLHHLGNQYSESALAESLKVLSPYLKSDFHKLFRLVDYILNTKKDSSKPG